MTLKFGPIRFVGDNRTSLLEKILVKEGNKTKRKNKWQGNIWDYQFKYQCLNKMSDWDVCIAIRSWNKYPWSYVCDLDPYSPLDLSLTLPLKPMLKGGEKRKVKVKVKVENMGPGGVYE